MAISTAGSLPFLRVLGVCLVLFLAGCSSSDAPRLTPTTADVETNESSTSDEANVSRQAGEPGVGRAANLPGPEDDPILHILGSIRSVSDPSVPLSAALPLITSDVTSIASVGCSPSTCPSGDLAPWAIGQIEVFNVATQQAASEGNNQLGTFVEELRVLGLATLGYGQNIDAAVQPVIAQSNDKRIAIHAISLDPTNPAQATESEPGVAGVTAFDALREAIVANRSSGLGVVVLVDWGTSDNRSPSPEQIADIDLLAQAGADAIVGHGSDFLLRFDLVDQTAVAYGLGNASVSEVEPLRTDTAVLRLEFTNPGRSCLLPAAATPNGPILDDSSITTCVDG